MTTFVLRFIGAAPDEFRGRVRHVSTGEEDTFTSPEELYDFLERMNASLGVNTTVGARGRKPEPAE